MHFPNFSSSQTEILYLLKSNSLYSLPRPRSLLFYFLSFSFFDRASLHLGKKPQKTKKSQGISLLSFCLEWVSLPIPQAREDFLEYFLHLKLSSGIGAGFEFRPGEMEELASRGPASRKVSWNSRPLLSSCSEPHMEGVALCLLPEGFGSSRGKDGWSALTPPLEPETE